MPRHITTRPDLKRVLLCTVFGPLTVMVCSNFGILHITIGSAAVFAALEPFFTYLLAVLLHQEHWRPQRMTSILMALAGMLFLNEPPSLMKARGIITVMAGLYLVNVRWR